MVHRYLFLSAAVALSLVAERSLAASEPDPAVLAAQIDRHLQEFWHDQGIEAAPRADDAEYLRRVYLDITGRIPPAAEVYAFLADTEPDKRARLVDRLLLEPRYAIHFANVWRAELLPEVKTSREVAQLEQGFENWLRQQIRAGTPHDVLVRTMLTVPLPTSGQPAAPVLRDPQRPNPLAFIAAKESRPENLAAAATRTFLGIRLECAQCHDHPFAPWSQEQFWSQAAFFAGLQKQSDSPLSPLTEAPDKHAIAAEAEGELIPAAFLVGGSPNWSSRPSPRQVYADWLTAPENPYFARAAVNRLWGQFFGVGIVEPVDDFQDDNPPSHPELLNNLASAFLSSGFDTQYLIRAICQSRAYQMTSARTVAAQDESPLPARMRLKSLTGEQFFDSFVQATGLRQQEDRIQRRFLTRFASERPFGEPETSVQQALTLSNGRLVAEAIDPHRSPTLIAITQTPHMKPVQQIRTLYAATVSRLPTAKEETRLLKFIGDAPAEERDARLADLFWMLLNTVEFRVNH